MTEEYLLNASDTWVCPNGVTSIQIEAYGAGGPGADEHGGVAYGGGGGGAYSKKNAYTVVPGVTYYYEAGQLSSAETDGNPSIFYASDGSTVICKAMGGGAGNISNPGTGGAAASGVGDVKYSGGDGGVQSQAGGGGGGAAGPSGNGGNGTNGFGETPGSGGSGGGGMAGSGGSGGDAGQPSGSDGSNYGGAGGGSGGHSGGGSGGFGATGAVILTYEVIDLTRSPSGGVAYTSHTYY